MKKVFQYLYDKKGKQIPFLAKLAYGITLNEDELIINDNLDFSYYDDDLLLPTNLTINGNLYLDKSKITHLPDKLTINGEIYLWNSEIASLPNNLTINGELHIYNSKISDLPDDLNVNGFLYHFYSPLTQNIKNNISLLNKYKKPSITIIEGFVLRNPNRFNQYG